MTELELSEDSIPEEFHYYADDGLSFKKGLVALSSYVHRNKISSLIKPSNMKENIKKQYEIRNLIRFKKYKSLNDQEINKLAVLPGILIALMPLRFIFALTPLLIVYLLVN